MKSMPSTRLRVEHAQCAVDVAKVKAVVDLRAVDGEQRFFAPAAADVERRGDISASHAGQDLEHAHRVIREMRHALNFLTIEEGFAGAGRGEPRRGSR